MEAFISNSDKAEKLMFIMLKDMNSFPMFKKISLLHLTVFFFKEKSNQGEVDKVQNQISDD